MIDDGLDALFEGFERQIQQSFESGRTGPEPGTALVVSCSMAQCQHAASLWPIDVSWQTCSVRTLGAQVWDRRDGQQVVDETLTHLTAEHDVHAVVVVGHTDCEVLAEAYERSVIPANSPPSSATGVDTRLAPLVSLVDTAVETGVVDRSLSVHPICHRLVEYTVVRQVAFLTDRLPSAVTVVGYVHDQDGVYDTFPGNQHLVTVDGETDVDELSARLPDDEPIPVGSLLQ